MVLHLIHLELFFFPSAKFSQDVIIFCVGMSSSVHFDNKKIDSTKLTAKKNIQLT